MSSTDSEVEDNPIEANQRWARIFRPGINLDHIDFMQKFRLSPNTIDTLIRQIGDQLKLDTDRNYALSPNQQLLLGIRYLATGDHMRLVGDAHGVSKATMSRVVHRVVESINLTLFDEVIKWPDDIADVPLRFFCKGGLSSVVSCVDGMHIPIRAPTANEDQFVNHHGDHSLNCMMVAGPDYKFYYVSACWPGSVHDAHVLRNSSLFTKFDGDRWRPIPNAVLLGNSGYPLKEWLVPPLLRPRNDAGARFNIAHKGTRRIVENSFGILKKSFTSLEKLRVDPTFAGEIVKCCCILHNMLLDIRGEEGIEDNYNIVIDPNIKAEETSSDEEPNEIADNVGRDRLIRIFA